MRCLSPRRAVVGGLSWICVLVGGLLAPVRAEDHPFAVVSFASMDRLRARAASLGEAIGSREFSDKWIVGGFMGDESMGKLFNSPGFDPTRPLGIMSYPKWFNGAVEEADNGDDKEGNAAQTRELPALEDLFTDPLDMMMSGFTENATVVLCFPAKDREQLLAAISKVVDQEFQPIAGRPGWFEGADDDDMKIGFVGRYVLLVADDGKVKQWDRDYPDFEKLAKASLGQNGFAYSLYRRGLPKLVRENMAEAFKLAHAASYQRHDNEDEPSFKFRTMFGPLMTESLDLLLSQIEEFRITGHVDSDTNQTLVDVELIGPKDGKLAKLANSMTAKSNLFGNLPTDDALFAANVSLPLGIKLWKPVAETLHAIGESNQHLTGLQEVARTLAKTIEAGQLELHASYTRDGEGLLALRVAGNPEFPGHVQAALETFAKLNDDAIHAGTVKLAADSVEGWPVHRVRASILDGFELGDFGWSNLTPDDPRPVVTAQVLKKNAGGEPVQIGETQLSVPAAEGEPQNYLWVVATPSGLWLALSSPEKCEFPGWCRSAIAASLAKPTGTTTATRGNAPVRVVLRGLGASPAAKDPADNETNVAKVTQAAAIDDVVVVPLPAQGAKERKPLTAEQLAQRAAAEEIRKRQEQQGRERGDLLRDGSNAIRVELRPTSNGLRLRSTFDDAYFHWFATMMKHSLDEQDSQVVPFNVEPPELPSPPPPLK